MLDQQISSSQTSTNQAGRRTGRLAFAALLLLVAGFVIFKVVVLSVSAWETYRSAMHLRALATTSPALSNLPAMQEAVGELETNYARLSDEVQPLLPAATLLSGVPEYGPLAVASPELLDAGGQGLALFRKAIDLVAPVLEELQRTQPDAPPLNLLLQAGIGVAPQLPEMTADIEALRTRFTTVDTTGMPEEAGALLQALPQTLALAEIVTRLGPQLPALLGMDGPRTYLILVQNNHELRATGGFIAAIGKVTLDQGRLVALDFVDSYAIYRSDGIYPPAPMAMQEYMNIPLLVMRDANWSPDLPTAAKVARALYKSDMGVAVDGIVTVDLNAVKRIFGALGEVPVAGFDAPLTGDNIEEQIVRLWERPAEGDTAVDGATPEELGDWWAQRKDFIPALTQAALARVQGGGADYVDLAAALHATLTDRSIQLWLDNPEAESVLAEMGWDGALRPAEDKDFLAVVDTNMGYNKANAAVERALDYRVAWPDGATAPAQATLTLTYTHPIDADDPGCDLTPRYGNSYADLIARCYFNYIRVYTPVGSNLISVEGVEAESVTTQRGERRTQVFTGYFILPPRHTNVVTFTYTLPPALTPDAYALVLQRQSGTMSLPVSLDIDGQTMTALMESAILTWPAP